ncbi:MAG: hypothetical protein AAF585_02275 [Verrucomicrobiota bacterium]
MGLQAGFETAYLRADSFVVISMKFLTSLLLSAALFGVSQSLSAQDADAFAAEASKLGKATQEAGKHSMRSGVDEDWFFLTAELLHVGTGQFWTKDWADVSENGQDPIPFMVQFQQLLADKNVELLVVPVPAKSTIYPDKLVSDAKPGTPHETKPFFAKLKDAGLNVLDLEHIFAAERAAGKKMHCAHDAHFSPYACQVIAKNIIDQVRDKDWFKQQARPKKIQRFGELDLGIVGDLVPEDLTSKVAETLKVQYCGVEGDGKVEPVEPDAASPILLLGDSHTLVFQEGASRGMHARAAGLLDQLQAETGFACDLVGAKGSGMKTARVNLYRKAAADPSYWTNKKLVIWCFSVREFTQSFDKLVEIPIERQ